MDRPILFLHVPKVAGSSINSSPLSAVTRLKIHSFKGAVDDKIEEIGAGDAFKYCFVRNPWDRFFSLYNYFYNMSESHPFYKYNVNICKVVKQYRTFEEFVIAFPGLRIRNNFHFYPQVKYLFSKEDELIPDFVGRFEDLQGEVNKLCEVLEIKSFKLGKVNVSTADDYREFYSDKSKSIVEDVYQGDIKALHYTFD